MTYDFNLLFSHEWRDYYGARQEVFRLLKEFGDNNPVVRRTVARGLGGVITMLDNRQVIASLKQKFASEPAAVIHTLKWEPIDLWCEANTIESMKQALTTISDRILPDEKWMMRVEKRRYVLHHKAEIITELAELFHEKVDLENPDKIVLIEIIGNQAGISVIRPLDIFSSTLPRIHLES